MPPKAALAEAQQGMKQMITIASPEEVICTADPEFHPLDRAAGSTDQRCRTHDEVPSMTSAMAAP